MRKDRCNTRTATCCSNHRRCEVRSRLPRRLSVRSRCLLRSNACTRRLSRTSIKAAEFAVGDADVRVVEMAIDVVIGRQAVLAAADSVCQFAESVEVGGVEKSDTFVKRQTLAVLDLKCDVY